MADVWLGDAARALAAMRPTSRDHFAAIVRTLGFDLAMPAGSPSSPTMKLVGSQAGDVESPGAAEEPPAERVSPAQRRKAPAKSHNADGLPLLEPVDREDVARRQWDVAPLPPPSPENATADPPYEPLLAPRSTSTILQAALSRGIDEGDLDVDALVETLADHRPVDRLPRRRIRTMRFGVQVLVDLGHTMQLFERDAFELVERVRHIAGRERTTVNYFAYAPQRGAGEGPEWTWQPYRPPAFGTRVLVVSDFGIGGPRLSHRKSRAAEWRQFAECIRMYDCDAVGLVPYLPHRWPREVVKLFPLVAWDRSTTVGAAFMATGQ